MNHFLNPRYSLVLCTTALLMTAALALHSMARMSALVESQQLRIAELESHAHLQGIRLDVYNAFVRANQRAIQEINEVAATDAKPHRKVLRVTAYTADQAETDDDPTITASSRKVRPGIVAVSRDLFAKGWSFGKKVYIKNMGVFTIEDLMHQRKTNQIDVFMPEVATAQKFGVRNLEVVLLDG